ncbi:MAG TPA: helix-turn-helix transcriptional regulator [Kofleriaceae bacterium]|jgi:transcriptional regulator with XRE-family HTH domain
MNELSLESRRKYIAERVRELRLSRRWTQAELAKQLELSQSRLSEIETGHGSFTAEQLLRVLALFNVGVEEFVGRRNDPQLELQNALARFGAKNLVESERVVPTERLGKLPEVIRGAIVDGSPRLVTALAPVLAQNADDLSLKQIYAELERIGHERRLAWVVENTQRALEQVAEHDPFWRQRLLRVRVKFTTFLEYASKLLNRAEPLDILDATIRSNASLATTRKHLSRTASNWRIATTLGVEDFVEALRAV